MNPHSSDRLKAFFGKEQGPKSHRSASGRLSRVAESGGSLTPDGLKSEERKSVLHLLEIVDGLNVNTGEIVDAAAYMAAHPEEADSSLVAMAAHGDQYPQSPDDIEPELEIAPSNEDPGEDYAAKEIRTMSGRLQRAAQEALGVIDDEEEEDEFDGGGALNSGA